MTPLALTLAGLIVGLAGIVLVVGTGADAPGIVLAAGGWAAYWVGTFRLLLGRLRRRR